MRIRCSLIIACFLLLPVKGIAVTPDWALCSREGIAKEQCGEFTEYRRVTTECQGKQGSEYAVCVGNPFLISDDDPEYQAFLKKYGVTSKSSTVDSSPKPKFESNELLHPNVVSDVNQQKTGGAGRAAFATLLAAAIGMGVGVFVSRRIGANATGKGAKDTAKRWMGFGVMIGIVRFFVAGLSPVFAGVAGAGKGFAEGVVLIIIYAPIGYILGYIVGKFRGEKEQENGQDWAGDLHVAKPEAQGGDALASEGMLRTQPLANPKPEAKLATSDTAIYERIANELETGNTDKATWTKAFALADGDDKQTRAKYIKLRFAALSSSA